MDTQFKEFTSVYIPKIPRCALSVIEWVGKNLHKYKFSEIQKLHEDLQSAKKKMVNNEIILISIQETPNKYVITGKCLPAKARDEYFLFISCPRPKEAKQNELFLTHE